VAKQLNYPKDDIKNEKGVVQGVNTVSSPKKSSQLISESHGNLLIFADTVLYILKDICFKSKRKILTF